MNGDSPADRVVVHKPGGDGEVTLDGDTVTLTGPAVHIADDRGAADVSLIERAFRERIVLVGVTLPPAPTSTTPSRSSTSSRCSSTPPAPTRSARVVQRRDRPDPATYVGKGKAEELRELSPRASTADTVVFDDELTPAQQLNLEKLLGRTAIDRTAVILDIFAQNAHSQEGKAQVELAQLRYRLPRLRGQGGELSASRRGGIGTRSAVPARRSSRSTAGACCAASTSSSPT